MKIHLPVLLATGLLVGCSSFLEGPEGPAGVSVTTEVVNPGDENCPEGGVRITRESETHWVCNGPRGPAGPAAQIAAQGGLSGSGSDGSPLGVSFGGTGSANTVARSDHTHPSALGEGPDNPAESCAALNVARPGLESDFYWLMPSTVDKPFRSYCDMETDGGGWTLVWSNLRGRRGKPMTELQWATAINTTPIYSGAMVADPDSFLVYTGLAHWRPLAPNETFRYSWAHDYGEPISQSYKCNRFAFTPPNYILGLIGCTHLEGDVVPGIFSYHNTMPFSTYDKDNHPGETNCAANFSRSPFWYNNCVNGSINGGGEDSEGQANGAFWVDGGNDWGSPDGKGAGNGWIFVR